MTAVLLAAAGLWTWPALPSLPRLTDVAVRRRSTGGAVGGAVTGGVVLAPTLVAVLATGSALVTAAAAIAGATAVWSVRSVVRRRRAGRDAVAVLDAVRALRREIVSGADLDGALAAVRRTGGPAVERMLAAVRAAITDDGVAAAPSGPAGALAAAARLSRRTGVPLDGLLTGIVDGLAEERRTAEQRTTAVAGARMSAGVLAALPLMGVLLGAGMGADPLPVLFGGGLGSVLLLAGTALLCAGLLWSARIAR